MDGIMTQVATRLITALDPVTLVLICLLGLCHWTSIMRAKEDREDRNRLVTTLEENNKTIEAFKNVISAALGKPL